MRRIIVVLVALALLAVAQRADAARLADNSLGSPEHRINCAAPCWPILWITIRPE